jgi:hypothetical protein
VTVHVMAPPDHETKQDEATCDQANSYHEVVYHVRCEPSGDGFICLLCGETSRSEWSVS